MPQFLGGLRNGLDDGAPQVKVSFHLTDDCQLRCVDCHWFSGPITPSRPRPPAAYIQWSERWKPAEIRLTGGEPALYPGLDELVLGLHCQKLVLCTNGESLDTLSGLPAREGVEMWVGRNREVDEQFERTLQAIGVAKGWRVGFVTYRGPLAEVRNEVACGEDLTELLGSRVSCQTRRIRFASDGWAYNCEVGLRTKDERLRCGFGLDQGTPEISTKVCVVEEGCLSCFVNEQAYEVVERGRSQRPSTST